MAQAQYAQNSFLGGEWSQTYQGRFDKPEYRTAMNVCFNGFPLVQGPWTRRPGLALGSATNQGLPARVIEFAFQENMPYTAEFTALTLRFFAGYSLAMTNDAQTVSAISSANPAVVTCGASHGWSAGATVMFNSLGTVDPLLMNRQFTIALVSGQPTKFTVSDAVSGATLNGAQLQAFSTGNVTRVQTYAVPYAGQSWGSVQFIQGDGLNGSEGSAIMLHGSYAPQVLSVTTNPAPGTYATFAVNPANFQDGPYLSIITNGSQVTPSAVSGIISLTLSFPAWSATTAYSNGSFVTQSSVCYMSLADQNFNVEPGVTSGWQSWWVAVPAAQAIGPNGFVSTDVGRHVRLASEPALWASGTTYPIGASVTYGAQTYWTSLTASNTGNVPGVDMVNWAINPTGATWTWGKITSLVSFISGTPSGIAHIGTFTNPANAFNGTTTQNTASSATFTVTDSGARTYYAYIGQNYSGCTPASYAVGSVTLFPPTDEGLLHTQTFNTQYGTTITGTAYLYASNSPPGAYNAGTLLGTTALGSASAGGYSQICDLATAPVTITSSDQVTLYAYVWAVLEVDISGVFGSPTMQIAQMEVVNAVAGVSSNGVNMEILGPPLLATSAIRTWQLGLFNGTVGWPTCGTYHEGRLWFGGSVNNRFDASIPNQNWANSISFAPTQYDGTVTAGNAISYTLNAPSTNTIQWFKPDLQGILIGTERGEWLVFATTLNAPLSPLNIDAHQVTRMGSAVTATAQPVQTEHTTVFIQRFARKVIEYFTDIFSGKFTAPDLAESSTHLSQWNNPIVELAYQQNISPNIWARTANGSLLGCAYRRDTLMSSQGPTSKGWHRHSLGSGRLLNSIAIGPSPDGSLDTLAAVTTPVPGSGDAYHVCFMNRVFEETDSILTAAFLDEAVSQVSYSVVGSNLVIVGLWYLNGLTCDVFAGGLDCGAVAVANGSCSVPLNTSNPLLTSAFIAAFAGAMPIVVGFSYTSQGQLLTPHTPAEAGTRTGPALANTQREHRVAVKLVNTQGISFGTSFTDSVGGSSTMKALQLRTGSGEGQKIIPANQLFTGITWAPLTDPYSMSSKICWQITRPFPATVTAIGGSIETADQ